MGQSMRWAVCLQTGSRVLKEMELLRTNLVKRQLCKNLGLLVVNLISKLLRLREAPPALPRNSTGVEDAPRVQKKRTEVSKRHPLKAKRVENRAALKAASPHCVILKAEL
eukprot:3535277-Amphidinium_carterae.1